MRELMVNGSSLGMGTASNSGSKTGSAPFSIDFAAFRDVLIPHMRPGLVAGALLAFTLSLDDFVITFFTSGPDTVTFPVKVYSMVRFSVTPEVNAASTALIVITLLLTPLALWMQNRSQSGTPEPA